VAFCSSLVSLLHTQTDLILKYEPNRESVTFAAISCSLKRNDFSFQSCKQKHATRLAYRWHSFPYVIASVKYILPIVCLHTDGRIILKLVLEK